MGLLPFYLFCGPELGEKNEAIEKLRIQARKKLGQLDEHLFYSFETPLSNVNKEAVSVVLRLSASEITQFEKDTLEFLIIKFLVGIFRFI